MEACGLVVEYNPFHLGHKYHLDQSKLVSSADCVIAVMSGNFLQRGEPAIIDKFHRARAALNSGVDIVLELPFAFAVQNSDLFAKGSVLSLAEIGVTSICFGSEYGNIDGFTEAYQIYKENIEPYQQELKRHLSLGSSFPEASRMAYHHIGLTHENMDLSQPNNILGFSYVKNIFDYHLPVEPITIKRTKSGYHDQEINHQIASATSIRKELLSRETMTNTVRNTVPSQTENELTHYRFKSGVWHNWEKYFALLQYRVLTMSLGELRNIQGMEEGLEYRIKKTAAAANDFQSWMEQLKTKRYTWTRLQRLFVHILTNIKKEDLAQITTMDSVPYLRLLGMSKTGQKYLNQVKKKLHIPLVTQLQRDTHPLLDLDERATDTYYSIIPPHPRAKLRAQELSPPIIV